jgi:hypothetical protein
MVEFEIDYYELVMKFFVPGMIVLAVLGVLLFNMGDFNVFGDFGGAIGSLFK